MSSRLNRRFPSWVWHHALEFKWFYLGAFICLYVLQTLQSEIPERIRELTIIMSKGSLREASVWIFVGLALGILFFRTSSRLLFFYPARVQQKLLRMELLELLEAVPAPRYAASSQGQIFQILFDDINNLRAFIGFGLLQVGNLLIAGWVLIPKLNRTDPYLWPAFTPLFLSVVLFSIITLINQKIFKKMMDKKGEVQQFIIEAYEAKQTIKNFHREESFIQGFYRASAEELSLFFKSAIGFAISGPYVKLGLGASLLWGAILVRAHGGTTADLVYFSGFLYLFLEPVMFLSWVAVIVSQGFAAWKRVKGLHASLNTPTELERKLALSSQGLRSSSSSVHLELWGKPLELGYAPGKWTVLIGETGIGKSYLLTNLSTSLILQNLQVSMVQQEPYLFNDTIRENIFLGRIPDAEALAEARALLRMFQLDSLAPDLDAVLGLEVGENGKRLSGGQMKRVALVRSLLSGSDLLVWDDPFSSVDIILEKKIITSLRGDPKWQRKTFFISSHRLTTVRLSDDVIYLEREAGIRAQGPAETIIKDEHVAKFFKEQVVDVPLA